MPNRIIREGWLESERVNQLDAPAERFFLRVCLRADDFGRYHANPVLLKSNLFPLRDDVRSTDIPRWLTACETAGLIRCYEVDGKRFLEIPKFEQRTRAQRSKFPAPGDSAPHSVSQPSDIGQTDDGRPRTDTESGSEPNSEPEPKPCAEAPAPPAASDGELPLGTVATNPSTDPIAMSFPTVGDLKEWPLRQSKVVEYRATFPGVDVDAALREARQWCIDNEKRRKTAGGMLKFLFGWLERRQNEARGTGAKPPVRRASWA